MRYVTRYVKSYILTLDVAVSAPVASRMAAAGLVAFVGLVGLVGCGTAGPQASAPAASRAPASSAVATPSSATPTSSAPATPDAPLAPPADRCGTPENRRAKVFALKGPGRSTLPAISVGAGTTYAVLLHQTDRPASCGWWPYANWLATTQGVHALAFDLCNYGKAVCPDERFAKDQVAQARLGVEWARSHGARRVVIVGASMGGAIALDAAVATKADAVVDLSGPSQWPPLDVAETAPRLSMPTLIVIRPGDLGTTYDDLKAAFPKIPAAHKRFVTVDSGHGWSTLNDFRNGTEIVWLPLATTVADWINGRYS